MGVLRTVLMAVVVLVPVVAEAGVVVVVHVAAVPGVTAAADEVAPVCEGQMQQEQYQQGVVHQYQCDGGWTTELGMPS